VLILATTAGSVVVRRCALGSIFKGVRELPRPNRNADLSPRSTPEGLLRIEAALVAIVVLAGRVVMKIVSLVIDHASQNYARSLIDAECDVIGASEDELGQLRSTNATTLSSS
jgi:hypothetical protein